MQEFLDGVGESPERAQETIPRRLSSGSKEAARDLESAFLLRHLLGPLGRPLQWGEIGVSCLTELL